MTDKTFFNSSIQTLIINYTIPSTSRYCFETNLNSVEFTKFNLWGKVIVPTCSNHYL